MIIYKEEFLNIFDEWVRKGIYKNEEVIFLRQGGTKIRIPRGNLCKDTNRGIEFTVPLEVIPGDLMLIDSRREILLSVWRPRQGIIYINRQIENRV